MSVVTQRQLALRIACLHADDQQWLLARLPQAPRQHLQDLLDEIAASGLELDEHLVNTAVRALPAAESAPVKPEPSQHCLPASLAPHWAALLHHADQRFQYADAPNKQAALTPFVQHIQHSVPPGIVAFLTQSMTADLTP